MTAMRRAMYPIERCVGVGPDERGWFHNSALCHDAAYMHIVAYTALAYFDTVRPGRDDRGPVLRDSHRALVHMNRGIQLLRKRIAAFDFASADATIFLVLALGMFSEAYDELDAAQKHLRGLHQLVQLRGGIKSLASRRFLQIKCCRLDLAIALQTGGQPLFFSDDGDQISWQAYLSGPYTTTDVATPVHALSSDPDTRLINVWLDLFAFTTAVNLARQTKTRIAPELFQEALISVHYRLHRLSREGANHSDEGQDVLRHAMLAFSTTFFLEVHSGKFQSLAAAFRSLLQAWQVRQTAASYSRGSSHQMLELNLWMTFVAAVSVLGGLDNHYWLREEVRKTTQHLNLTDWNMTRAVLKQLLWVEVIHDAPGKKFYESLAT